MILPGELLVETLMGCKTDCRAVKVTHKPTGLTTTKCGNVYWLILRDEAVAELHRMINAQLPEHK